MCASYYAEVHPFSSTAGDDYEAILNRQITFSPGETSATITVNTIQDQLAEGTEVFEAFLSDPRPSPGVVLGGQDKATVNIIDDEGKPLVVKQ